MQRLWTDRLARLSAGLAVVVLLAAEEKVCPHLLIPPAPADAEQRGGPEAAPAPGSRPPAGGSKSAEAPAGLTPLLPDVIPARWSGWADRVAQQETIGAREGTVACGPLAVKRAPGSVAAVAAAAGWWRAFVGRPDLHVVAPRVPARAVQDPAVKTLLLRTGPPGA